MESGEGSGWRDGDKGSCLKSKHSQNSRAIEEGKQREGSPELEKFREAKEVGRAGYLRHSGSLEVSSL